MTSSSNLIDVVSSTTYQTGQHTLQQNSFSNNISTEHNADVYQNNSNLPQSGIKISFINKFERVHFAFLNYLRQNSISKLSKL